MLRNTILRDIRKIDNPAVLNQLFEYLQLLKKNVNTQQGNTAAVDLLNGKPEIIASINGFDLVCLPVTVCGEKYLQ